MHEYTEDEVREKFLKYVWTIIDYWEGRFDPIVALYPCRRKLEGLAFSMLVTLDGGSMELPGFIVAPDPHPEDKEFLQGKGENWYPENYEADVRCDIGGCLHELFHKFDPREKADETK